MKKTWVIVGIVIILLAVTTYLFKDTLFSQFFRPTETITNQAEMIPTEVSPEVVAGELNVPWELVFLPEEEMLVTERGGRILRIGADKKIIPVSGVSQRGEGGLLGLALDPDFKINNQIYIYLTTNETGSITNRVERYKLIGTNLSDRKVLVANIPGAQNHDGGRIAFGPDSYLYITTGDAGVESNSQDKNSLAGKILRIKKDGKVPNDNPFGNAVYSYGHRNVQGISWDKNGNLWATEHGRSGTRSGFDEVNKIVKGQNYGWPESEGDNVKDGTVAPQRHSGSSETWAPAGSLIYNNNLIFTGLRGESLYVGSIESGSLGNLTAYFREDYGRLRSVVLGPDGLLYILTNNRDGRGRPNSLDDRIIRFSPDTIGL